MDMLVYTGTLLVVLTSTGALSRSPPGQGDPCDPPTRCRTGQSLALPGHCNMYVVCEAGTRWTPMLCAPGTSFDSTTRRCINPAKARCHPVCATVITPLSIYNSTVPVSSYPVTGSSRTTLHLQPTVPTFTFVYHNLTKQPGKLYSGKKVVFRCEVKVYRATGIGSPTFLWHMNTSELFNSSRVYITPVNHHVQPYTPTAIYVSILTFDPISWEDTGVITCVVDPETTEKSIRSIDLKVLAKPEVSVSPLNVRTEVQNNVIIICDVSVPNLGYPLGNQLNVSWFKNQIALGVSFYEKASVIDYNKGIYQSNYTFKVEEGETFYGCRARNDAGESELREAHVVGTAAGFVSYSEQVTGFCEEEVKQGISWTNTPANKTDVQNCPKDYTGKASRYCSQDGVWLEPNMTGCISKELTVVFSQIDQIGGGVVVSETVEKLSEIVTTDTNDDDGMGAGNLNTSLEAVILLAETHDKYETIEVTRDEVKGIINVVNATLSTNNDKGWKDLLTANHSRSVGILQAMDKFANLWSELEQKDIEYDTENLGMQVLKVDEESDEVSVPKRSSTSKSWIQTSNDKVVFNKGTLNDIKSKYVSSSEGISISSTYYRSLQDILPTSNSSVSVGSRILSATVENRSNKTLKLEYPVEIQLKIYKKSNETLYPICVFWNFSDDSSGSWSSDGCDTDSYNENIVTCRCYHLTNFAILMSPHRPDGVHDVALSIISIVGCCISIICLLLTLATYAYLWKKIKSHHTVVFVNLCVALLIATILFLAGAEATNPTSLCQAMAVLLHYFFLAVFFLMFVEGVELILHIVFVFHVRSSKELIKLLALGWGTPVVIVAISVAATQLSGYGDSNVCWLSPERGLHWAFIGPVIAVIVFNVAVLVIVIYKIAKPSAINKAAQKKKSEMWRSSFWNLVVLTPLLGVTWIIGVFATSEETIAFQYIFAIFNSAQGLFIFLFHCVFNKRVKEALRERLPSESFTSITSKPLLRGKRGKYPVSSPIGKSSQTTSTSHADNSKSTGSTALKSDMNDSAAEVFDLTQEQTSI